MTAAASENLTRLDWNRVSISDLAQEFKMSNPTVAMRLREGGVGTDGKRYGKPTYRLRDAVPVILQPRLSGTGGVDPDDMSPKDRLDHYKAEREKLRLAEDQNQVVDVDEARAQMAAIAKLVVQMLETLPDVLERDCQIGSEAVDKVEKEIDLVREHMAQALEGG